MTEKELSQMPSFTPFSDPEEVLSAIRPVTDLIHSGLIAILPRTRGYFDSHGRPVDKALHAMLTRFELRHHLLAQQILADNEEEVDSGQYTVQGIANCGLIVKTSNCVLRILKSQNSELPASNSSQRYEFYQHNLFAFGPNDPHPELELPPLNLVAAWNTDGNHELGSLSVVCPLGEKDGKVHSKWWQTLSPPTARIVVTEIPAEPDLDEIKPRGSSYGDVDVASPSEVRDDGRKATRKTTN